MANEKRLIDAYALWAEFMEFADTGIEFDGEGAANVVANAPTVDAVEMPKGKPGDYLEWDNGAGFRQIYHIHAVMICEDCMRYDLEKFAPDVNHPNIVRILSLEEAEKEWKAMCAKALPREEPTLTACCAKMDGDGNG